MRVSREQVDERAERLQEAVESRLQVAQEYGGPLVERYGRTALIAGVATLAVLGVAAVILTRRRQIRRLTVRALDAMPDDVGGRIQERMSSIRAAASRRAR